MPRALILGATGQDGQFLADFLLEKGYEVLGVSRNESPFQTNPISLLRPQFITIDISHGENLSNLLEGFKPEEIYNLAGQSSVSRSFQHPTETINSNVVGVVNLLNAIKKVPSLRNVRVFQASSAEMFGTNINQLNESSPFNPVSPYAYSKLAAHKISNLYRENYNFWISCGILFNHESELRPETFVFQKIVASAVAISKGKLNQLTLGNTAISRDWGYSRDYVEAMWLTLQAKEPQDYIIATGERHTLKELIEIVFGMLELSSEIENFIIIDGSLSRPTDVSCTWGNPHKINTHLGWSATTSFQALVERLVKYQIKIASE